MFKSRLHLLFLALLALLGAGCGRRPAEPIPEPREGVIQEIPVPEDLTGAEKRASKPGPPIEEIETPPSDISPWDLAEPPTPSN